MSDAAIAMLTYIRSKGSATIAELMRVAEQSGLVTEGDITIAYTPFFEKNMISWAESSAQFVAALRELRFDTFLRVARPRDYVLAGRSVNLPLGRPERKKPYVKRHWLPVTYHPMHRAEQSEVHHPPRKDHAPGLEDSAATGGAAPRAAILLGCSTKAEGDAPGDVCATD